MPRHWLHLLTFLLASAMLVAQEPTTITAAEIDAKAKLAAELSDIDEATKTKIAEIYLAATEQERQRRTARLAEIPSEIAAKTEATTRLQPSPIENAPVPLSPAVRTRVEEEGRVLLGKRKEYFDGLGETLGEYGKVLQQLDSEEHQLAELIREKTEFVNQEVLWIRSSAPIRHTDWRRAAQSAVWFFEAGNWHAGWTSLVDAVSRSPALFLALTLLSLLLIVMGAPMRRRVTALGKEAASSRTTSFRPTAWALVLIVLATLGWPLLIWHLATLVSDMPKVSGYPLTVAHGLAHAASERLGGLLRSYRRVTAQLFLEDLALVAELDRGLASLRESPLRWPPMTAASVGCCCDASPTG